MGNQVSRERTNLEILKRLESLALSQSIVTVFCQSCLKPYTLNDQKRNKITLICKTAPIVFVFVYWWYRCVLGLKTMDHPFLFVMLWANVQGVELKTIYTTMFLRIYFYFWIQIIFLC